MQPSFQLTQLALTAHVREPSINAAPAGIEDRRLNIYRELLYKNIEGFISSGFPIVRKLYSDERWHSMVRDFMHRHESQTPYFAEIGQEFLTYLENEHVTQAYDPAFLYELAHYEWVEVAIDLMDAELDALTANRAGDLLQGQPKRSPLAWVLSYDYPVHKIGPGFEPQSPSDQPTVLIVYRNRYDDVKFIESNAVTARLLTLIEEQPQASGRELLQVLAAEMHHPNPEEIVNFGSDILTTLRDSGVLLGTRT